MNPQSRFLLTGALACLLGCRQTPPPPPADNGAVLQQLLQIEDEIAQANRNCDYAYFRNIEADEFLFTDAAGNVTTKEQDLATEKDCHKSDAPSVVDEARLLNFGDVAILSARNSVTLKNRDGKEVVRRNRFTDVFMRRDGRWQLVSGHSSRIPEPATSSTSSR